jgi:hypothetical protein
MEAHFQDDWLKVEKLALQCFDEVEVPDPGVTLGWPTEVRKRHGHGFENKTRIVAV